MAKLSEFKINSAALQSGEWIFPGEEYSDLEILTRGYTDTYQDARAAKLRRAAMGFGGDQTKVPSAIVRAIVVELMISHVLLDVRGLSTDDGKTVSFAEFCDILRNPDYPDLYIAALKAAGMVGQRKAEDLADATKNLPTASAIPLSGEGSAVV